MTRAFTASALIAATALLATVPAIADYQDSGFATQQETTTLSGTVQRIISPTEFTLRYNHRVVRIDVASDKPPVLNEGDNITVTGISADGNQSLQVYSVLMNRRDNT